MTVSKLKVEIREAKPADARKLNLYTAEIYASSQHLITRAEEYRSSTFKHRLWIAKKIGNPVETCLLAVSHGQVIGMLENWTDRRLRVVHVTCFAMSVLESHRKQGVGKALLGELISWVKAHHCLSRLELHVHSDNSGAIKLYKSLGFELEGIRKGAVRYEDGRVIDDHIMALWP